MSDAKQINPGQAHILGQKPAPETPAGAALTREQAIQAMMAVGYEDFEAELLCQLNHYVACIPGLVKMGSPLRDKILVPISDLQAAIAMVVTSRRLQARVEEIRSASDGQTPEHQDQDDETSEV